MTGFSGTGPALRPVTSDSKCDGQPSRDFWPVTPQVTPQVTSGHGKLHVMDEILKRLNDSIDAINSSKS